MNYNFIKYNDFNSRSVDKTMSITRNNSLGISASLADADSLNKYTHAVLYFDPNAKSIGVKFTTNKAESAKFALTRAQVGKGLSIIAHSFFKKNKIVADKYAGKKYLPKKLSLRSDLGIDESGFMYVVDLENEMSKE